MSEWHGSIPSAGELLFRSAATTRLCKWRRNRRSLQLVVRRVICCSFACSRKAAFSLFGNKQTISSEGKCWRELIACSIAAGVSPSTTKRSKSSRIKMLIASESERTIRISRLPSASKIASTRSWNTGSLFKMRTLVSKAEDTFRAGSLPLPPDGLFVSTHRSRLRRTRFAPLPAGRRSGVILRGDLMRGAEVHLCKSPQCLPSLLLYQLARGFFYAR